MTYLRNIPMITAQRIPVPSIAPLRVAKITSPEPIYSEHQINDGPIRARTINPLGAVSIVVSFIDLFVTADCTDCTDFLTKTPSNSHHHACPTTSGRGFIFSPLHSTFCAMSDKYLRIKEFASIILLKRIVNSIKEKKYGKRTLETSISISD